MRDIGLGIEDRFFLTAQELEYCDTDDLGDEDERKVDEAIDLLYRKIRTKDFEFTDEEREILEDAFVLVNDQ